MTGIRQPGSTAINSIKRDVTSCQKCDLCSTRTNAVPGAGSANADIVFVGEAPGRSEDLRGEPFVGAAGARLTAALYDAGLSRGSAYITNVVKCRPPDNRVPTASERETCTPYLQAEIDAINPLIVCVLGNTAFGSVLGGSEITKNRGKTAMKEGRLYYITIHPAAAIYNQELRGTFAEDIKRLARITEQLREGRRIDPDITYPHPHPQPQEHGAGDE